MNLVIAMFGVMVNSLTFKDAWEPCYLLTKSDIVYNDKASCYSGPLTSAQLWHGDTFW